MSEVKVESKFEKKVKKKAIKIIIVLVIISIPIFLLIAMCLTTSGGGTAFYESNTMVDANLSDEDNAKMLAEIKLKTDEMNNNSTFDESGKRIGKLCDYYGTDSQFVQDWTYTLAYLKYKQISSNDTTESTVSDVEKRIDEAINDIAPKFVYKSDNVTTITESTVTTPGSSAPGASPPGSSAPTATSQVVTTRTEKPEYFITSASNVQGTYVITYKNQTIVNGVAGNRTTETKPVLLAIKQTDKGYDNLQRIVSASGIGEDADTAAYAIVVGRNIYLGQETMGDNLNALALSLVDTGAGTFSGTGENFNGTVQAFIDKILPEAKRDYKLYNILPSITLAQAILESADGKGGGPGTSLLTVKSNNLFGVKAYGWSGPYVEMLTREEVNGNSVYVLAKFRAYSSFIASVADHANILLQSNFLAVRQATNYVQAANALRAGGYATDSNYPGLIIGRVQQYGLAKYDVK